MKLLLGIGTFKRVEKLKRLLASLDEQTFKDFYVVISIDNKDYETEEYLKTLEKYKLGQMGTYVHREQVFIIGHWNYIVQNYFHFLNVDGFVGLCDDVTLYPDTLENIVECHKTTFPNGDGVCGFRQVCEGYPNYTFKWFGQTLMDKKFIERYKDADYKICCPDYSHFFQDEEMYLYANDLLKFQNCYEAVLNHDHPSFTGSIDETHNLIRKGDVSPIQHDKMMKFHRQEKGYLWGKDFKLISNGE